MALPIHRFDTVTSTNDEALRLARAGEPHGAVVVAARQTGGRGRLGRRWASPEGGLWLSMILRPESLGTLHVPMATVAVGVAVADAMDEILGELGLPGGTVTLGWPNDLLVDLHKLGGILLEASSTGPRIDAIAAGIGVNVNVDPTGLPDEVASIATSVRALARGAYPLDKALAKVVRSLHTVLAIGADGSAGEPDAAAILEAWRRRSALTGRTVRIQGPGTEPYAATVEDIDDAGRLVVRDGDDERRVIEFEEATLLR